MAKDDRLRIPIDKPYLDAVGLAVISFARLEWMAVDVVQRIGENGHNPATNPKYVGTVSAKTAGQIANDLLLAADGITDVALRNTVKLTAEKFKELTKRRNDLMHANPGTSKNNEQRLFRHGDEWTIPDINDLSDEFTECNGELNDLYYKVL